MQVCVQTVDRLIVQRKVCGGQQGETERVVNRGHGREKRARGRAVVGPSPPKPPHDEEKPEDDGEEDDVPEPAAALARGHVVHAPERAREDAGRLCERVVLMCVHARM